jgi:hypothetical protein
MQRDSDFATGLVGPLSNLRGFIDGDTGGDNNGSGDYKA